MIGYIPDESAHGGADDHIITTGGSSVDIQGLIAKVMPIMMLSTVMGSFGGNGIGNIFKKIMPLVMLSAVLPMLTGMFGGSGSLFG